LRRWKDPEPAIRLLFVMLVIALVLPRFMIYSYLQLLPAAWLAIKELMGIAKLATVTLLCVVLPFSFLLMARPTWSVAWEHALGMQMGVWGYASFYGALTVWGIFLGRIVRSPVTV
jgi:hypothetical protein